MPNYRRDKRSRESQLVVLVILLVALAVTSVQALGWWPVVKAWLFSGAVTIVVRLLVDNSP